jgi:hypothetical protein
MANTIQHPLPTGLKLLLRTPLLRLLTVVLAFEVLSGCGRRDLEAERSNGSAELVDARQYLRNAPPGSLIHMPLSAAVGYFYEGKKRLPENLDELVQAGLIKAVPQAPAGMRFFLDRSSMQVLVLPP